MVGMNRKHRFMTYYPGIAQQEDAEWLRAYLRERGKTFSQELRPLIAELIRKYKAEQEDGD